MSASSGSTSEIQSRIASLEGKRKEALQRLERMQKAKKEGDRYYRGTELPIDDVIFSLREGLLRSLDITLDFYRKDLERQQGPAA